MTVFDEFGGQPEYPSARIWTYPAMMLLTLDIYLIIYRKQFDKPKSSYAILRQDVLCMGKFSDLMKGWFSWMYNVPF